MNLAFGADHAGREMRDALAAWASEAGHNCQIHGALTPDSFDYPRASDSVCQAVLGGESNLGILVCGTGIGVSIRANRYHGIRAALCTSVEMGHLAREHNFANVLCLGARILSLETAAEILREFLSTEPSQEGRHQHRVELLDRNIECAN